MVSFAELLENSHLDEGLGSQEAVLVKPLKINPDDEHQPIGPLGKFSKLLIKKIVVAVIGKSPDSLGPIMIRFVYSILPLRPIIQRSDRSNASITNLFRRPVTTGIPLIISSKGESFRYLD